MYKYGQYCPVARATEILGDRWTLLIVRNLIYGMRHFNELVRGLPGISRALLAERLRRLEKTGVVEKIVSENGRSTEYQLTQAGEELQSVIDVLTWWGARWAFGDPAMGELDPHLLLFWMCCGARVDQLPQERVVVQLDFCGAEEGRYWLVLTPDDVSACLQHPGFAIDLLVTADLATFFQVWLGRITFAEALREQAIEVDGIPALARAFPRWFTLSPTAPTVRAESAKKAL